MIKAIETKYKGYRFRSRLEARWAVFFGALGLQWEYEPEGFDLGDGVWYLPDFRVELKNGIPMWVEVKPAGVVSDDKFNAFADAIGRHHANSQGSPESYSASVIVSGDPIEYLGGGSKKLSGLSICPRCGSINKGEVEISADPESFWICYPCDITTPSGSGTNEKGIFCTVKPYKGAIFVERASESLKHFDSVGRACQKARSARFEHGEAP